MMEKGEPRLIYSNSMRYSIEILFEYYDENNNLLNENNFNYNKIYRKYVIMDEYFFEAYIGYFGKKNRRHFKNTKYKEIIDFYWEIDYRTHNIAVIYLQFKVK